MYGPVTGSRISVEKAVERVLARTGERFSYGRRPLDEDWDVLIVLDACRADLFREFAPDHGVFGAFESVEETYSCASTSREWFDKAFADDPSDVHYVTQNPHLAGLDTDRFHAVERLWEADPDAESGLLEPATVTDVALSVYRESTADRFVVHYMSPHAPFLHCVGKYDLAEKPWGGETHDVWLGLQVGAFEEGEVWEDYGQNLLTVLEEVARLIDRLSGSIVITADHANAMGELGVYGHPGYVPLPALKRVPWVEASGRGIEYDVDALDAAEPVDESAVTDRLEALGYR